MKNFRNGLYRIGKYDEKTKDPYIEYSLKTEDYKRNARWIIEQIISEMNRNYSTKQIKSISEIRILAKKNVVSKRLGIVIEAKNEEKWENLKILNFFDDDSVEETEKAILWVLYDQGVKYHLIDGSLKGFQVKLYM